MYYNVKNKFIKTITLLFCIFSAVSFLSAQQTGKITGKIIDAKSGETVVGVTVRVSAGTPQYATQTDLDGVYYFENIPIGVYKLEVSYVGYAKKIVEEVTVKAAAATLTDISISEESTLLATNSGEGVIVTAKRKQESVNAILTLQKNNIAVSDGLSGEAIKRSPDRNTAEVLRRVSGVTIQDNKFPIIRGLSDRYNLALVNGALLPSTETEKRAFSFDMFPSSLIDNILVNKTATPDMYGDFAGGLIQLVTKDIPDENFVNLQVSSGINSNTQGNPFISSTIKGSNDWLGIDGGARALPSNITTTNNFVTGTPSELAQYSTEFTNDWAYQQKNAQPNLGLQFSTGWSKKLGEQARLGAILGVTYNRSQRITNIERSNFSIRQMNDDYDDVRYSTNYLNGVLFNLSYKINDNNKISLKNNLNISTDDLFLTRTGKNFITEEDDRSNLARYRSAQLFNSQLSGDHVFGESSKIKLKWIAAYNNVKRDMPNQRQMRYNKNFSYSDDEYLASIPSVPSPTNSGKLYSGLNEATFNANVDISYPLSKSSSVRVGGGYLQRERDFSARIFGIVSRTGGNFSELQRILKLPQDQIFDAKNISENTIFYREATSGNDKYNAETKIISAFGMYDGKLTEKLRAVAGVRFESYPLLLTSQVNNTPLKIDETFNAFMPSVNLIYSLTEKSNLRLSGAKTVSRPELRELSPFSFFDYERNRSVVGNPNLKPADVYNLDLRYELFPSGGQVLSVSAFYKYFKNPIEEFYNTTGINTFTVNFSNGVSAQNFGVELETRKNLAFIKDNNLFNSLTVFTNLAYINSEVTLGETGKAEDRRALQGQSGYIINGGLQYSNPDNGWGGTILFNQIGRRISEVGNDQSSEPHIYEAPRALLDFQLSKKFLKENGVDWAEIRFNISDILNRPVVFYQDFNQNGKFDTDGTSDNLIERRRVGTNYSVTFNYKF